MKLIYGFGINDVDYVVKINATIGFVEGKRIRKQTWICPFYRAWIGMLARVFDKRQLNKNPAYSDCSICEDWRYLSNFKAWMEQQDWEGNELDKDLLVQGNRVYSPDTCVFVSRKVNCFIIDNKVNSGEWLVGCSFNKRDQVFQASCKCVVTGKQKALGSYSTQEEAHQAWLAFKLEQAIILASMQSNEKVAQALIERYTNYKLPEKRLDRLPKEV